MQGAGRCGALNRPRTCLRSFVGGCPFNISRAAMAQEFPCSFLLVCGMNPCPCGYQGDPGSRCRRSSSDAQLDRRRHSNRCCGRRPAPQLANPPALIQHPRRRHARSAVAAFFRSTPTTAMLATTTYATVLGVEAHPSRWRWIEVVYRETLICALSFAGDRSRIAAPV